MKVPLSVRVEEDLLQGLEEAAHEERRTLSNLSEILLEYALSRRKLAGSLQVLLTSPSSTNPDEMGARQHAEALVSLIRKQEEDHARRHNRSPGKTKRKSA